MKLNYSEPKIFTGGVDITKWSKLSKKEQNHALKKDWYVYYSFRHPETGKLVRQTNIKANANSFATRAHRLKVLKPIQRQLLNILSAGYNPYSETNTHVIKALKGEALEAKQSLPVGNGLQETKQVKYVEQVAEVSQMNLKEALKLVLDTKQKVLNENSYPKYKSRINRFYKWLYKNGFKETDGIEKINKKVVIKYLNSVLQNTSPRNRNNARIALSSFVETLIDNDVFEDNFVKKIKVLKATPTRNKTYQPELLEKVKGYMAENDAVLSLFVDFVSYGFLRPIEVCRLKVGDLDLKHKRLYVKAKNQPVKEKIIPEKLLHKIPDLTHCKNTDCVFTPSGIGGEWDVAEPNKRDYFTKRFKKVKDHFELGSEYGLYSFRHTTTTDVYRELAKDKNLSPHEIKSRLMLITGHSSMSALESYLREIDAVLPKDYSHLLKS